MRGIPHAPFAACLALATGVAAAQGAYSLSTGADRATGKYGTPLTSTQWTIPFVVKYETPAWSAKLAVPYVRIENPTVARDGTPLPCAGSATAPRTASGIGDTVLTLSRNLVADPEGRTLIDLVGKVKFATADEAKCLGTGEDDYYLQADLGKGFGALGVFASLGWRKMGDPPGTDFDDPLYYAIGLSYRTSPARSYGIAFDHREPVLPGRGSLSEATVFLTHRYDASLKMQGYAVVGFSDSSPDWALGAVLTRGF